MSSQKAEETPKPNTIDTKKLVVIHDSLMRALRAMRELCDKAPSRILTCLYCDWQLEVRLLNDDHELTEHVEKGCPNHPLRMMEKKHAENEKLIADMLTRLKSMHETYCMCNHTNQKADCELWNLISRAGKAVPHEV